jgi:hypothetical protein
MKEENIISNWNGWRKGGKGDKERKEWKEKGKEERERINDIVRTDDRMKLKGIKIWN